jgi:hypothetical protein
MAGYNSTYNFPVRRNNVRKERQFLREQDLDEDSLNNIVGGYMPQNLEARPLPIGNNLFVKPCFASSYPSYSYQPSVPKPILNRINNQFPITREDGGSVISRYVPPGQKHAFLGNENEPYIGTGMYEEKGAGFANDLYEGIRHYGNIAGRHLLETAKNPQVQKFVIDTLKEPEVQKFLLSTMMHLAKGGDINDLQGGDVWGDIWNGVKDTANFLNDNAKATWQDPQTRKDLIDLGVGALTHGGKVKGGDIWQDILNGAKDVITNPEVKHEVLSTLAQVVRGRGMKQEKKHRRKKHKTEDGSGFWDDVWSGVKQGASTIGNVAKDIISDPDVKRELLGVAKDIAISKAKGSGVRRKKVGGLIGVEGAIVSQDQQLVGRPENQKVLDYEIISTSKKLGRKPKIGGSNIEPIAVLGPKIEEGSGLSKAKIRGQKIAALMREHKCSLGEASKLLKEMSSH